MNRLFIILFTVFGLAAFVTPRLAAAANCTVINPNDTGGGSLRNCIDVVAINDGDVITIDPAVTNPIALTTGPLDINVSLTIQGAGAATSIIDGSGNGNNRIFSIDNSPAGKTVNITGVTLQGASLNGGGAAIFLAENNLNLSNCTVKDNLGHGGGFNGGAIAVALGGNLVIDNCEFINNRIADGRHGGAIANEGTLSVDHSTFSMNTTEIAQGGFGGAIFLSDGSAQIQNTNFLENKAGGEGGAIYHGDGSELIVMNSSFDNNSTGDSTGGAIYNGSGHLSLSNSDFTNNHAFLGAAGAIRLDDTGEIENCLFEGNTAGDDNGGAILNAANMTLRNSTFTNNSVSEGHGGAIYVDDESIIENCTFAGNHTEGAGSDDNGGGIFVNVGPTSIVNSTLFDNQAQHDGGGLYINDTTNINNLTIANNTALNDGGGVFVFGTLNFSNSIIAGNIDDGGEPDCLNVGIMTANGPSLIQDPAGCVFGGDTGQVINGNPNLAAALADNGGPGIGRDGAHPTLTLALANDSIALEEGDNATCAPTDQRGVTRPQGPICDLGAFESGPTADLSTDTLNFGNQDVGSTSGVQTVTLTNNGPVPLTINSISLGGTDPGDFEQTNDCGGSVAPGASCNIDATFTPSDDGARSAEISIDSNFPFGVTIISLVGVGVGVGGGGGCSFQSDGNSLGHPAACLLVLAGVAGFWIARKRA